MPWHRYHANAITTTKALQEVIQLARDIRAARHRGEESGLSDEEIAFYDALAENDSAVQVMGDASLRLIACELLTSLRTNTSVDWAHRESARARMRTLVKRILRKHGYPPNQQAKAVQTVLQQAEALSTSWCEADLRELLKTNGLKPDPVCPVDKQKRPTGTGWALGYLVETRRIELPTSALRTPRSPS